MLRYIYNCQITIAIQRNIPVRDYHSVHGVYGYRPKPKRQYKVAEHVQEARNSQSNIYRWVEAYRQHGHKFANIDSINIKSPHNGNNALDELNPAFYGLNGTEYVKPQGLLSIPELQTTSVITVHEIETLLKQVYMGNSISAEFSYIEDLEEREWLAQHFESLRSITVKNETRKKVAELLIKSQAWNNFMAVKYPTVKRYGGEGSESVLAFFWKLLQESVNVNLTNIVMTMNHRGRTELQTLILNMPPVKVFHKLSGESDFPKDCQAMSDVISHFHSSEDINVDGKTIHVNLIRNPSHLEAANPVAMGKTRSKQQFLKDGCFSDQCNPSRKFSNKVLNIILHGDAAFTGQGVNQECLNNAYVPHFEIGGTIHVLINNQIGFTTPGDRGRSTTYASDLAKFIEAPIFHVNGDDPDVVMLVTQLAFNYQREFRKDVFIDLNCYRRWGHNELDDPMFTNPLVYTIINNRKSVPDMYIEKLTKESVLKEEEALKIRNTYSEYLNQELQSVKQYEPKASYFKKQWQHIVTASSKHITYWDTGLDYGLLQYIGEQSIYYPETFNIHSHLKKTHVEARRKKLNAGEKIDWATAEALAIGSLMYQGHNVRISGEDVGRGTFSHRHVMLVDQQTNEMYIPLNDMEHGLGGKLEIANSILSEEAVLGFEYGMAIDNPDNLIIWEAQFGDFNNGAQIIIDNFLVSGESKWMECNALVMLLPHGYDGAASEHSSCRMERFLQLSDSRETDPDSDHVNINIVNPTTPAQYFHLLRRQLLRNFRKPLIIVAPKILLRLSAATSTHIDFQCGTQFLNVIPDTTVSPQNIQKVLICSGKHYYVLNEERKAQNIQNVAIIRLESLCPFPLRELQQELQKYNKATKFIWCQEEQRNMGAWNFVKPRFENLLGKPLLYCGRPEAPTTATGIGKIHKQEVEAITKQPFQLQ